MKKIVPFFILITLCPFFIYGQDKEYVKEVDTFVVVSGKAFNNCDSSVFDNEQFLPVSPDGGGQLTIYKCKDDSRIMVEWIGLSYGHRIRTFYCKGGKLIYVTEVHFEFTWNASKNEYDRTHTQKIYSAAYYIKKDFYEYAEMTYEPKSRYHVESPEPITYVAKLIKTSKEYLAKP